MTGDGCDATDYRIKPIQWQNYNADKKAKLSALALKIQAGFVSVHPKHRLCKFVYRICWNLSHRSDLMFVNHSTESIYGPKLT